MAGSGIAPTSGEQELTGDREGEGNNTGVPDRLLLDLGELDVEDGEDKTDTAGDCCSVDVMVTVSVG